MQMLIQRARRINKLMDGIQFWSMAFKTGLYDREDVMAAAGELRSFTEEYATFYNIATRVACTESGTEVAPVLAKVDNSVRTAVDMLSLVLVDAAHEVCPGGRLPVEIPALPGPM